jgi:rhodanese-related sulfurtransferase
MIENLSPKHLGSRIQNSSSIKIIDVRTPAEFDEIHIQNAENIPLDQLNASTSNLNSGEDGFLYFICQSGGRSRRACEAMMTAGHTKVINIEGGTIACEAAGLPVVRGRKTISLERQVRIATGSLVFVGVLLGSFGGSYGVQCAGLFLAGFIGAGLVFAGVTDTCGIAIVIAKMPWNQSRSSKTSCKTMGLIVAFFIGMVGPLLAATHTKDSLTNVRQKIINPECNSHRCPRTERMVRWSSCDCSIIYPLSELRTTTENKLDDRLPDTHAIIYCHCLSGGRCLEASRILTSYGYDARALQPSYSELIDAGFTQARQ